MKCGTSSITRSAIWVIRSSWVETSTRRPRRSQLPDQDENTLHLNVVEMSGGLVCQHQGRVVHEGPGDGYALLLATGHLSGSVACALGQAHFGEELVSPCRRLMAWHLRHAHRCHDVALWRSGWRSG